MSASRARTASSLSRLRPTRAHFSPWGPLRARYSAVSAPVNPVAPKITRSNGRGFWVAAMASLSRTLELDGTWE